MIRDRIAKTCEDFARRDQRVNVARSSSVNTSGAVGRPVRAISPPYIDLSGELPARDTSWADSRLVFASITGGPIDHRNDTRAFKALLIAVRVRCDEIGEASGSVRLTPRVRLHDLRHTAATLLLAQGVPARVLMEVLGHSRIGVTMNIYSHVMPSQLLQTADAMENALWGTE
jgi:integrase